MPSQLGDLIRRGHPDAGTAVREMASEGSLPNLPEAPEQAVHTCALESALNLISPLAKFS
jgi:hypothetical protein